MGSKYHPLTQLELTQHSVNKHIMGRIVELLRKDPDRKPEDIKILDWGCGRGRSVLKLREQGFSAYGVDIDMGPIENGAPLFQARGFHASELMGHIDRSREFEDGYFDLIFSQQVFEHVEDIHGVMREFSRLTKPGGFGLHTFPGAWAFREGHVHIPMVHWTPKNWMRRLYIWWMLKLVFKGPSVAKWPHLQGVSFRERVDEVYRYLNEQTHYRSSQRIAREFDEVGFDSHCENHLCFGGGMRATLRRRIPRLLRANGWPSGGVVFFCQKRMAEETPVELPEPTERKKAG